MTRELISVVIPCFNGERYLAQTLDSVLQQTYENLEIIVVDDKSTDQSVAVANYHAAHDRRIALVSLDRNRGAPAAPRNIGVRHARGKWIAFLDADDVWHPRKLEYQSRVLEDSGSRLCSTQMRDFNTGDSLVFQDPGEVRVSKVDLNMQLVKYRTPTSSVVVDRELMLKYAFNEDPAFKAREDTDCFIRLHEIIPFSVKLDFPFVRYRRQGSQISGNKFSMVGRHLNMLRKYRLQSGEGLGVMAYVYTLTHFGASIYVRAIRRRL